MKKQVVNEVRMAGRTVSVKEVEAEVVLNDRDPKIASWVAQFEHAVLSLSGQCVYVDDSLKEIEGWAGDLESEDVVVLK